MATHLPHSVSATQPDGAPPYCRLELALASFRPCSGQVCPFWEEDVEIGCVLAPIDGYLQRLPDVASHLLKLRQDLEQARGVSSDERPAALEAHEFHRLLSEGKE